MRRSRLLMMGLAATLTLSTLVAGGGAGAAAPVKKVCLGQLSPSQAPAGAEDHPFTFSVTNQTEPNTQPLGSANLNAPSGFTLKQVVMPPTPPATASINGNTLELRNMNLNGGQSATVAFTADVPAKTGDYTWSLACKQSNEFLGTGNDFQVDRASTLTTTVDGETPRFGAEGPNQTTGTCQNAQTKDCTISSGGDATEQDNTQATVTFKASADAPNTYIYSFTREDACPIPDVPDCIGLVVNLGLFPFGYAGGQILVEVEYDSSIAPPGAVIVIVIETDEGVLVPAVACLTADQTKCVQSELTDGDGDRHFVVQFSSEDPRMAGICIPPC